jgi:hypothetical protein
MEITSKNLDGVLNKYRLAGKKSGMVHHDIDEVKAVARNRLAAPAGVPMGAGDAGRSD